MKKYFLFFLLVGIVCMNSYSQSNEFIDQFINTDSVTLGQAAYLVLVASDNLGEDANETRAFDMLNSMGWAPKDTAMNDPVNYKQYSYLLMRSFGLKGGIMYAIAPGPRYAYRYLASALVIQDRTDPNMHISGVTAIRMLGRIFEIQGITQ